jgi:drug/metabolite transporter (DMT)-like permease
MGNFFMKRTNLGILLAILSCIVYGIHPPAVRAVYEDGGNPVFIIVVTTVARALAFGVFCVLSGKQLFHTRKDTKNAVTGGFFQAIAVLGVFASLLYLPGPVMIIILFTHTLMLLFFMAWRGEVKLGAATVVPTVAALGGLSLVLDIWHPQKLSYIGIGLAFAGAIATMSRFYVYGNLTKTRNPAVVGAEAFSIAALFTLLLPLATPLHIPATSLGFFWAFLGCLSLVTGSFLTFYSMSMIGSFKFSLFSKIEPVFTSLFSILLIGEYLSWHQYVGILVVLGSLAGYQYMTVRQQRTIAIT